VADVPLVIVPIGTGLDLASDSGASSTDGITNVNQPTFAGTTEPGAVLRLFARRTDAAAASIVGTGVADATGAWRITSSLLGDGRYDISVTAVDRFGVTTATVALAPIVVDTAGPRIDGIALDPRTGQVRFGFRDGLGGLNLASLTRLGTVAFGQPTVRSFRPGFVSNLALAPGATSESALLVATIAGGRRLAHGRYVVQVRAAGVTDVAGNTLDGEFFGAVPSGDGRNGGDFVARLNVVGRSAFTALPLAVVPGSATATGLSAHKATLSSFSAKRKR